MRGGTFLDVSEMAGFRLDGRDWFILKVLYYAV